ncbi:MAG: hypothetical protein RR475_03010 [Clostridia bacterium]
MERKEFKKNCEQPEQSMSEILSQEDVKEAAQIISKLPMAERRVAAALVQGYALGIEAGRAV